MRTLTLILLIYPTKVYLVGIYSLIYEYAEGK
jgi:hypothetical protein